MNRNARLTLIACGGLSSLIAAGASQAASIPLPDLVPIAAADIPAALLMACSVPAAAIAGWLASKSAETEMFK